MIIEKKSAFSGKMNTMDLPVTQEQLDRWQKGRELIQDVFPHLSPDQREFLMTGTTPEEWNAAFPPEDEDERMRYVVTYTGPLREDFDNALRAEIPGADGSGYLFIGDGARDITFTNDWSPAQVEEKAREICGAAFKSVQVIELI